MPATQYPLVTSLMAGIFNSRPPQPKYIFVWDAQVILNFIRKIGVYLVLLVIRNGLISFVYYFH